MINEGSGEVPLNSLNSTFWLKFDQQQNTLNSFPNKTDLIEISPILWERTLNLTFTATDIAKKVAESNFQLKVLYQKPINTPVNSTSGEKESALTS